MICLGSMLLVVLAATSSLADTSALIRRLRDGERPRDPPGVPARPVPGAPRAQSITFGPYTSIQVNVDGAGANIPGDAANEPSIAVDPNNPLRMAIGWRQFDTVASDFREAGWGYTQDGGRTWTFPGVIEPDSFRSDPVLVFDRLGIFYYMSLKVENEFVVDVSKSEDGGMTWSSPVFAFGGDKPWAAIDRTGGPGDGNMYVHWQLIGSCCVDSLFTRSTDGVSSFGQPVRFGADVPILGSQTVGPDGAVYVCGVNFFDSAFFLVSKSSNAQHAGMTPTFTSATIDLGGEIVVFPPSPSPNPSGALGNPWVVVDASAGPNAGNVYLLCTVDPPGSDPAEIHFTRSEDGGATWSLPVRVNDDPIGNDAWQWFGTMSIAPNGRLDVVWNDTRNTGDPTISQLFRASSFDGGVTWTANEALSPPFDSNVGWPQQEKIGDYYHMVSDDVGANLAWAATFNGEQDVYYLRIGDYDCNVNGVGDSTDIALGTSPDANLNGIPDECEGLMVGVPQPPTSSLALYPATPNPFTAETSLQFDVSSDVAFLTIRVFDVGGRIVRTLYSGRAGVGRHRARWDGRDEAGRAAPPGIYVARLWADGVAQSRKLLLFR